MTFWQSMEAVIPILNLRERNMVLKVMNKVESSSLLTVRMEWGSHSDRKNQTLESWQGWPRPLSSPQLSCEFIHAQCLKRYTWCHCEGLGPSTLAFTMMPKMPRCSILSARRPGCLHGVYSWAAGRPVQGLLLEVFGRLWGHWVSLRLQ